MSVQVYDSNNVVLEFVEYQSIDRDGDERPEAEQFAEWVRNKYPHLSDLWALLWAASCAPDEPGIQVMIVNTQTEPGYSKG